MLAPEGADWNKKTEYWRQTCPKKAAATEVKWREVGTGNEALWRECKETDTVSPGRFSISGSRIFSFRCCVIDAGATCTALIINTASRIDTGVAVQRFSLDNCCHRGRLGGVSSFATVISGSFVN